MRRTLTQASHLVRKGGVFYYRRVLPGPGRQQVAVSLGTRRLWEAEDRARELDAAYGRELERLRAMTDTPRPSDLAAILRDVLRKELARIPDEWVQRRPFAPLYAHDWRPGSGVTREEADLTAARDAIVALRRDIATNSPDDLAMMAADRLIAEHGLPVADRDRIVLGLLEVHAATWQARERRLLGLDPIMLGDPVAAPAAIAQRPAAAAGGTAPATPGAPPPVADPAMTPLASSLIDPHFVRREKIDGTRHQVMAQERTTLRLFREVCGDRPVANYRRSDVTTFLSTLRQLPNTYGRSPRDRARTVAEIIADADTRKALRLTDKTVKRHLTAVSQFFRFAVDEGHLTVAARGELVERPSRIAWTRAGLEGT